MLHVLECLPNTALKERELNGNRTRFFHCNYPYFMSYLTPRSSYKSLKCIELIFLNSGSFQKKMNVCNINTKFLFVSPEERLFQGVAIWTFSCSTIGSALSQKTIYAPPSDDIQLKVGVL